MNTLGNRSYLDKRSALQNAVPNSATEIGAQSRIARFDEDLRKNLCLLDERLGELRQRLDPIIFDPPSPPVPSDTPGTPPLPLMSSHAQDVAHSAQHASRLADRVQHLISVIEI